MTIPTHSGAQASDFKQGATPAVDKFPSDGPASEPGSSSDPQGVEGDASGPSTFSRLKLLPQHRALIAASAISHEVAAARGYFSACAESELSALGFAGSQLRVPALVIPIRDASTQVVLHLARPDEPRDRDGKALKYEMPAGSRMVLDIPAGAWTALRNPRVPLFITEGSRKADAAISVGLCCVSLIGVWCWRGTNEHGEKGVLPDFDEIAWDERDVFVVFDSDVMVKESVHASLERFLPMLSNRGARVKAVYLPHGEDGSKVGLDDFLAAGGTPEDVRALAEERLRPMPGRTAASPYEATGEGIVWHKPAPKGDPHPVALTNFVPRIVSDTVRDDGAGTTRWFTIEASLHGRHERFEVEATRFAEMGWVLEHVGADAIVDGAPGSRDRARAAVQHLSGNVPQHRRYAHTGWRQVNGTWVYLHADGAIGANGPVEDVAVELQAELERFELPDPPTGSDLAEAVTASIGLFELGSPGVMVPVLCAVYRAPLGPVDFSIFLTGRTGVFKTEIAALAQQHWGAGMDARNLPASWSSTANWTEAVLFGAKDAICVVDDFAPGGTSNDLSRSHRDADRVFRSQGNQAGRGRMRADSSLRRATIPRGLPLSTGEDVPRGHSLRARIVIVAMAEGDIDLARLTSAQQAARRGVFAAAMSGYVRWLAGRRDTVTRELRVFTEQLRDEAAAGSHRRTSANEAQLVAGLHFFLQFAEEIGAVAPERREALMSSAQATLAASGEAQTAHHVDADPVRRFLDLLVSEISSSRAHVADRDGTRPGDALAWGWRLGPEGSDWRPHGRRIGWLEGENLYLDPQEAYACAQRLADELGERLPLDPSALAARLHEAGLLATTNVANTRRTYRVRRTIQSRRREVLHLKAAALEPDAIPDPRAASPDRAPTRTADPHGDRETASPILGSERSGANGGSTTQPTTHAPREDGAEPLEGRTGRTSEQNTTPGAVSELPATAETEDVETSLPRSDPADQPDQTRPTRVSDAVTHALPWPTNPPLEGTSWSEEL